MITMHDYFISGEFETQCREYKDSSCLTGFEKLDKETGGLHPGTFLFVAAPGMGKTAFMSQLAENIALNGKRVLYFASKMTVHDFVLKSLARRPYLNLSEDEVTIDNEVVNQLYENIWSKISVIDNIFRLTAQDVVEVIREYISETGTKPVVIIDSLNDLTPMLINTRYSARELINDTLFKLCGAQVENNLVMIMTSATSRSKYYEKLDIDSPKESGELENAVDTIWGMEFQSVEDKREYEASWYKCVQKKEEDFKREMQKNSRKVQICVIKSRSGPIGQVVPFDFYADKCLFIEAKRFERDRKG